MPPVALGVAVLQEFSVLTVHGRQSSSVFDRAPIQFGTTGDFTDIGDQPVLATNIIVRFCSK